MLTINLNKNKQLNFNFNLNKRFANCVDLKHINS